VIDIERPDALEEYLRATGRIQPGARLQITVLSGGVSNKAVLVEQASAPAWVLKQALPKLRVPVDWFCSPERIEREALGMERLAELAPTGSITPLVFCDPTEHVLAMEAVPQPHENWKTVLLEGRAKPDQFLQFGRLLGAIHQQATERAESLAREFDDRGYFETLRLEPYYGYTAAQVPDAAPFFESLIEDTRRTRRTLVHGDYSPKNILVHAGRMILLDHEVIHWGDPAFDVGFSMAHLLSKARHLPQSREALIAGAESYWNAYRSMYPADESACIRHTIACLLARVAGRSQLEYLTAEEKSLQGVAVLDCIAKFPASMRALIETAASHRSLN
jgi:5-methylthioribose kinase